MLKNVLKEFEINYKKLDEWIYKYEPEGIDGLKESRTRKKYSKEFKHEAVQEYLNSKYNLKKCCRKYGISSTSVLRKWIKRDTSGESIKPTGKGKATMTKGRKTKHKERVEIAKYCIVIDKNYQQAAHEYQTSYQQVYQWVQKYEKNGEKGLIDRRERELGAKPNLSDEEKLQLENKTLEERNIHLEAEFGLLKKLEEVERRGNQSE